MTLYRIDLILLIITSNFYHNTQHGAPDVGTGRHADLSVGQVHRRQLVARATRTAARDVRGHVESRDSRAPMDERVPVPRFRRFQRNAGVNDGWSGLDERVFVPRFRRFQWFVQLEACRHFLDV